MINYKLHFLKLTDTFPLFFNYFEDWNMVLLEGTFLSSFWCNWMRQLLHRGIIWNCMKLQWWLTLLRLLKVKVYGLSCCNIWDNDQLVSVRQKQNALHNLTSMCLSLLLSNWHRSSHCLSCEDEEDRDLLLLKDGESLVFCAVFKCQSTMDHLSRWFTVELATNKI